MSSKHFVLGRRLWGSAGPSYMPRVSVCLCLFHAHTDFAFFPQAYGDAGVMKIIKILEREIVHGMKLLGAATVNDLVPELVGYSFHTLRRPCTTEDSLPG